MSTFLGKKKKGLTWQKCEDPVLPAVSVFSAYHQALFLNSLLINKEKHLRKAAGRNYTRLFTWLFTEP